MTTAVTRLVSMSALAFQVVCAASAEAHPSASYPHSSAASAYPSPPASPPPQVGSLDAPHPSARSLAGGHAGQVLRAVVEIMLLLLTMMRSLLELEGRWREGSSRGC